MPITIPQRLQEKLHTDIAYEGYVWTLIENTKALITGKAAFFPEYTIHGWQHIQAVLNHADRLIPDVSMKQLQGRDVALLIAGVILHDLGMFLNEAGVRKLLGERGRTKNPRLAEKDWKTEWDAYIHEIRRYPEEKLLYHFGMSGAIKEPDVTKTEFTDLERLIIGDFLRRHHHRIAHEIALTTMPGDTDLDVLQVGIGAVGSPMFNAMDRKCIGILARSHGMPIRKTWDYIRREIGNRYKEKLTYLMAVLRIADALDADEQRAPDTVRKLQGIRTPVSVKEWTWNQRIVRTDLDWDSDCKYVEAEPESTTEFVHLEKWLSWVQRELDLCWAVLSEVCDTQKYRLSIHRVDSNILEEERREAYGEQFITKEARLNANPELLKLLVAPLYDNDPSCGVRELLQNAVDACNERAHLEGEGYRGQVEIRLDTEAKTLTVTDNGIGMDENVLLNYYLSAGASYRTSDEWFQNYATDRDPNIVRTGRFGVGVLATFLLGNTVEVTTRHMDDEFGYVFQFGLEPEPLDIKRPEDAPDVGTTIKVILKDDALEKLQEDYEEEKTWLNWYRFAEPAVRYWVDGKEYVSDKPAIPQDDRDMPGWFDLSGTNFDMVRWGYPEDGFFCNGIRIPDEMDEGIDYGGFGFPYPCVSIADKSAKLPVDLSRRRMLLPVITDQVVFNAERYAMAQLLTADWSSEDAASIRFNEGIWKYSGTPSRTYMPVVCSADGFNLLNNVLFFENDEFPILEIYKSEEAAMKKLASMLRCMKPTLPIVCFPENVEIQTQVGLLFAFEQYNLSAFTNAVTSCSVKRVWSNRSAFQLLREKHRRFRDSFVLKKELDDYEEYHSIKGNYGECEVPFQLQKLDIDICPIVIEAQVKTADYRLHCNVLGYDSFFTDFIQTYMNNDPWIPYDMEERRKKFPKAFEELKYYIDRILADREKQ